MVAAVIEGLAGMIARLEAMDAERAEIAAALAEEAMQRGRETNGRDALYQGWCLLGGAGLGLAGGWLKQVGE